MARIRVIHWMSQGLTQRRGNRHVSWIEFAFSSRWRRHYSLNCGEISQSVNQCFHVKSHLQLLLFFFLFELSTFYYMVLYAPAPVPIRHIQNLLPVSILHISQWENELAFPVPEKLIWASWEVQFPLAAVFIFRFITIVWCVQPLVYQMRSVFKHNLFPGYWEKDKSVHAPNCLNCVL